MGRKLFGYFANVGATGADARLTQDVHVGADEGKLLSALPLRTTGPAIVDAGLASTRTVEHAVHELDDFATHPDSMLCGPRIFQVWAHRTAGS